ncbi:hypothetical protein LX99_02718 [Mucilaginibacter oryzae]|uniref:Uncharacterized protein n=1 Tax=Mucilaginibacter oryzae TaxID=468058 RepID=A0A316HC19_9SPHI|nr:hypothetical protein [Mucilaginibacter oryzae]PWK77833.1 hypothetical protein LX99_02718 [Mucilaginibacter oryzae]
MNSAALVNPLLLGGLLGLTGQSIRVIVGLKKTFDVSQQQNTRFKDSFEAAQLLISLLIGFVAGLLGILAQLDFTKDFVWTKDITIEIIAIGYAGADFIEGFIKKFLPSSDSGVNKSADANAVQSGAAGTGQSAATGLSTEESTEDIAG